MVCTIVASIKSSLGLVVACKKVGATHSLARGCRATHNPCVVGGIYVSIHDVCGGAVGSPSPWGLGLWVAPTAGSSIATTP